MRDVQIYVPCLSGSAQQDLARWYHEGLNAFEQTYPIGMALFEQYETLLKVRSENKADFEQLILQTQKQAKALRLALEKGRDRLLELNSNGGEKAQRLAAEIAQTDNSPQLVDFALNLFDIIGLEQDDLGENSIVITPTGTNDTPRH